MANSTEAPEDDYDVLIEDGLNDNPVPPPCQQYNASILSAQLVPQLYLSVFMVGLLDNMLVVLVLMRYKGLRHVENIYFLNVAISNVCFLLALPFWAHTAGHGGLLGNSMCAAVVGFYSLGLYSQALGNILLTVQRYLVAFNMRCSPAARTVPCGLVTSAVAWVTVILVTLPEFLFYRPPREGQGNVCSFRRPPFLPAEEPFWKHFLTLKMNILGFLFPLFTFVFCYARMRKTLWDNERRSDLFKLVFAIMVGFLLMWGPYNIALFLSTFREYFSLGDCQTTFKLDKGVQVTKLVAATHCCINPFLYVFLDKAFRTHFCHLCKASPQQACPEPAQDTSQEESNCSSHV
ncbi:C-C chemokine receptor-like 2 [Sorex fumeus]|uniref:C-C chemokine receptor-like 2 n=1 Tax=Sorex fumeus TaxID=62283 RepID=UPI0024AE001A|nr:C-C chemokine receptor-like 2 [Sorex fumeus]